jgi:hypothetical protein
MTQHPPQLDDQRALTAAAFVALIDITLAGCMDSAIVALPRCMRLLHKLANAGLAEVLAQGDATRLTLCGITASSNGTAYALLRTWQSAAKEHLAQAVRP